MTASTRIRHEVDDTTNTRDELRVVTQSPSQV